MRRYTCCYCVLEPKRSLTVTVCRSKDAADDSKDEIAEKQEDEGGATMDDGEEAEICDVRYRFENLRHKHACVMIVPLRCS